MRTRDLQRYRRLARERLRKQSLRSLARQMGVSHHALRCFLTDRQPIRARERTLGKIEAGLYRWNPYPTDLMLQRVAAELSWLETPLTDGDMEDIFAFIRRRIRKRRKEGYWVSYTRG